MSATRSQKVQGNNYNKIYVYMYIHISIYVSGKREKQRQRETKIEKQRERQREVKPTLKTPTTRKIQVKGLGAFIVLFL